MYAAVSALIAADTDRFREWFSRLPNVPDLPDAAQWAVFAILGTSVFSIRILKEDQGGAILPEWSAP